MLALKVENLKKTYDNGLIALKGMNLTVEEGDFFALLGPNGAGKSTFIGILCSLVNKTSGKIEVFGHDIDKDLEALKSCIGVVPQEMNFHLFEKIQDIVVNQGGYYGVPRKVALERSEMLLKKLDLWDKRKHAARDLSGGMKRRLMIARALINNPKVLILDEPTAGVDIELRHGLWDYLSELNNNGTTIILTTHYLEEAERLCKNVAIIDHGDIIINNNMKSMINKLHIQTIIFDLEKPIDIMPELSGYNYRMLDSQTLELELHKSNSLNNFFGKLSKQNIAINSMRNKTNRLEELFVRLINDNKDKA